MLSMQTLPSSSLPRQCICVCCLVELIGLAVFPAKQVAVLVSFWLHLCGCVSRLDRDDSVSSLPGAWPWLGDALAALSLVSHWPFGPTSDCVRVCERQIEKERASSGDQPESYRARMAMAANFTQYMMSWQNCSEARTHMQVKHNILWCTHSRSRTERSHAVTSGDLHVLSNLIWPDLSFSYSIRLLCVALLHRQVWSSVWSVGGPALGE